MAIPDLDADGLLPAGVHDCSVDEIKDRFGQFQGSDRRFRLPCEAGIALVVAVYSAVKRHSVLPGLLILGDLSIQGNIKSVRSLAEPLQVGMDNGARRALIPLENKRNFLDVSGDIVAYPRRSCH